MKCELARRQSVLSLRSVLGRGVAYTTSLPTLVGGCIVLPQNFISSCKQVHGLDSCPNRGCGSCRESVSAIVPTRLQSATYSYFRRKTSQTLSGGIRLRLACERASLARGTISICILACSGSKHDSVMLRGSAPRTPKSTARKNPGWGKSGVYLGREKWRNVMEMNDSLTIISRTTLTTSKKTSLNPSTATATGKATAARQAAKSASSSVRTTG
jgi:hypothetical protein